MRFFNFDNPLFQAINKIVDCLYLSLLWVLFSIPLVTIGASTSAAYYVANKVLRHGRGYVFQQFWQSFKSSFKQGLAAWLIYVALMIILLLDIRLIGMFLSGAPLLIFRSVFLLMMLVLVMMAQYVFPYIARFTLPLKKIISNSLLLAIRHLPWTILLVLLSVVCILLPMIIPFALFITPCVWAILASLILERIFKRYMTEEDRAMEEKLNRIDLN